MYTENHHRPKTNTLYHIHTFGFRSVLVLGIHTLLLPYTILLFHFPTQIGFEKMANGPSGNIMRKMINDVVVFLFYFLRSASMPGKFLGIVGQDPSDFGPRRP